MKRVFIAFGIVVGLIVGMATGRMIVVAPAQTGCDSCG
jgi:hypothetical protein